MIMRRVLLVVLDGLGIGSMDDALPSDRTSHTLASVRSAAGGLEIPNLAGMGLLEIAHLAGTGSRSAKTAAHGRARLGYDGADTYLGHQALMGAPLDQVESHMLEDRSAIVRRALEDEGHRVTDIRAGCSALLVDDVAVVADNIEAAPGLNINVTASNDEIPFDDLLAIGMTVRRIVRVPRVIVVGGRGYTTADVVASIRERGRGHMGVDTPALGVYDENYLVRHLGASTVNERTSRPNSAARLCAIASSICEPIGLVGSEKAGSASSTSVWVTMATLFRARPRARNSLCSALRNM